MICLDTATENQSNRNETITPIGPSTIPANIPATGFPFLLPIIKARRLSPMLQIKIDCTLHINVNIIVDY